MLLKMDSSTKWFAKLVENRARLLFIHGRLKHHTGEPANFPQMIAVLEKKEASKDESE